MKKHNYADLGTKDDQARRNALQKGVYNNQFQCSGQAARFARRQRADEAFAREMGVRARYKDLRRG